MQNDIYPSRVFDVPKISPRLDPVTYQDEEVSESSPLTKRQIDFFEENGFLLIDDVFTEEEISIFNSELLGLRNDPQIADREETILERDSKFIRSIFNIHSINSVFSAACRDKRVVNKVEQLLGSQLYIHQSRVNFKPGFKGKEFYWHSDFETWHVEDGMPRMRAISCSLALTENFEHNGPLLLIPGSHKHFVSCVGETPDEHFKQSLKKQEYGVPDDKMLNQLTEEGGIVSAKGKSGSIVLFDCNTMHGSNGNITPYPRSNLFTVYNSVENKLVSPFGNTKPRPEYIAARTETVPITAEDPEYKKLAKGV